MKTKQDLLRQKITIAIIIILKKLIIKLINKYFTIAIYYCTVK